MENRCKFDFSNIGKRIDKSRKTIGITQRELAERVCVTTNQIAKIETNKTTASLETMNKI